MDGWTLAWLLLVVAFLAVEVPGIWHRGATFSEHIWGRWFPERWQRGVFLFFWSGVLAAFSLPVAAWLSRHIGLVNTMVFTHIPSSVCLILAAVAPKTLPPFVRLTPFLRHR